MRLGIPDRGFVALELLLFDGPSPRVDSDAASARVQEGSVVFGFLVGHRLDKLR